MNAILLKTVGIVAAAARASGCFFDRFCRRWAGSADAVAARAIGSVVAVPVLLCAAMLASGFASRPMELAILAASAAGLAMIFCALSLMGLGVRFVAALNFSAYAAGLATLGALHGANAALWLLVAALPLEIWFVSRKPLAALAGAAVAGAVLGAFAIEGVAAGSVASAVILVLYAASLVARSGRLAAKAPAAETAALPEAAIAAGDVRFVLDAEGVVVSVGMASAKLLGVQPKMLEGTALIDRVHVADRVHYLSLLADLRAGETGTRADVRLRAVGEGHPVFRAFRMEGARAGGTITVTGRSLEGEQKLLDEIAALNAALQSERIGKGRLLAAVSHELRTPLNSIIGFSDMLKEGVAGPLLHEKQREYAGLIHQSGHYLLELVNAVLDNSRLETGSYRIAPQNFAFREAAEMCAAVMLPQAEKKGVAFCHRVGNATGELVADRRAVQQMLLNLAANAVKFTEKGGCVTIDAARVTAEGRAMLEFSVSDTGIGIGPDDLARIGTPFMRADNSYTRAQEGSGLGLSVVKGLVELHQGTMRIKSCPGEGTVVTIRLPVAGPDVVGPDHGAGEEAQQQEPGTVIDMHRHQGERRNDWQQDENREEDHAQARKTA